MLKNRITKPFRKFWVGSNLNYEYLPIYSLQPTVFSKPGLEMVSTFHGASWTGADKTAAHSPPCKLHTMLLNISVAHTQQPHQTVRQHTYCMRAHRVLANTRNGGLVKRGHLRVDELCGQLRWESSEQWCVFNWIGAAFKYVKRCHGEYEGWYNETERNPRTTVHWKNLSCMKKKWKGERNLLVPVATESCS